MKKNPIIVYWAPKTTYWNMLYPDPDSVINILYKRKNKNSGKTPFFACPSFTDKLSKTYSFNFPIDCSYSWDFSDPENRSFIPTSDIYINTEIVRPPSIDNCPQIYFGLNYLFFCEEPLLATFSGPYFIEPNYTKHAAIAPGTFDISQWFRPYPIEMTFWKEKGNIDFKSNEPLFYVEFLTDRPIILKRFAPTEKIIEYGSACANSSYELAANVPLLKRYQTFKNSKMDKLVLKEIKNNIL